MSRDDRFDDDLELEDEDELDDASDHDDDHEDDDDLNDSSSSGSRDDSDDDELDDASSDPSSEQRSQSRRRGDRSGRSRRDDTSSGDDPSIDAITGSGGSRRGYSFELDADGGVIKVRRIKEGRSRAERIERGEVWTFNPVTKELTQQETYATGTELSTYTDPNSDGVFTRISESFVPFSNNNPPSSIL